MKIKLPKEYGNLLDRQKTDFTIIEDDGTRIIVDMPYNYGQVLARMGGQFEFISGESPVPPGPGPVNPDLNYVGWTEDIFRTYILSGSESSSKFEFQLNDVTLRSMNTITPCLFMMRSLSEYYAGTEISAIIVYNNIVDLNGSVLYIGDDAFKRVRATNGWLSFPNCEYVGQRAFAGVGVLSIPVEPSTPEDIQEYAGIVNFYLPKVKTLASDAFTEMFLPGEIWLNSLENASCTLPTVYGSAAQAVDPSMKESIYLLSTSVVSFQNGQMFDVWESDIWSSTTVYVPENLIDSYKTIYASWSNLFSVYNG